MPASLNITENSRQLATPPCRNAGCKWRRNDGEDQENSASPATGGWFPKMAPTDAEAAWTIGFSKAKLYRSVSEGKQSPALPWT